MAAFRLTLLGPPQLTGPGGRVALRGPQAQALLWYIAAAPATAFSRAHLVELLWEGADERAGRASLSALLFRLRRALPVWPFVTDGDTLAWNPAAGIGLDVTEFETLAHSEDPADWEAAVRRWRGPFLDGFQTVPSNMFDEWLQTQRGRWEVDVMAVLARVCAAQEETQDWDRLAVNARRALATDALQERFHRWLMQALFMTGDRAAALSHYDACRQLLQDELGVEPAGATVALRDAIAGGQAAALAAAAASTAGPAVEPAHPLVGREAELTRTVQALSPGGRPPGAALLHGDAGIGKSRLMDEALQAVSPGYSAGTVVRCNCYRETQPMPLAPVLAGLERWRGNRGWHWLGQGPTGAVGGLAQYLGTLPAPVLLAVDDVQWADWSTLQLLALLIRNSVPAGMALLMTGRAGELPAASRQLFRQLEREGRLAWIELGPLPYPAIETMTAALTGHRDASLAARLYARTEGNPLFAVELLRSLTRTGEDWSPETVDVLPVPASITTVMEARLSRLPDAAQDLVAAAAVFPGQAPFSVLQQIVAGDETGLAKALEQALFAGVLQEQSGGAEPEIGFSHDLIRQVVLDNMSQSRRAALHRRALTVLAGAANLPPEPDTGQPVRAPLLLFDQLAYHAGAGGLWERAFAWSAAGARAAEKAFSMPDKARFLEQALDSLRRLPQTPARRRQAALMQLELAHALLLFRLPPSGLWPGSAPEQERPENGPAAARRLAETALPAIRAAGDQAQLAAALRTLGMALSRLGELPAAAAALTESIPLDLALAQASDAAVSQMSVAIIYTMQGEFERARALSEDVVARSRQEDQPLAAATVLALYAVQQAMMGQWGNVRTASREAASLSPGAEFARLDYLIRLVEGPVLLAAGQVTEALAAQTHTAALAEQHDNGMWAGFTCYWLAVIQQHAGQAEAARATAARGAALADEYGDRYDAALCRRALGESYRAAGDHKAALPLLTAALTEFAAMAARPELARSHAALARLPGPRRDWHAAQASTLFAELGMDPESALTPGA